MSCLLGSRQCPVLAPSARSAYGSFPAFSAHWRLIGKDSNGSRVRIAGTTPRGHICDTREAAPSFRARLAETGSAHHRPRSQDNGRCSQSSKSEKQLDRTQVAGLAVDLRRLGATQRVCAIGAAVHSRALDPAVHYARVLASRQIGLVVDSAWKDVGPRSVGRTFNPSCSEVRVCSVISN